MPEIEQFNQKIITVFKEQFGDQVRYFEVEMKHSYEICTFIRQIESAHKATANSKLIFK